MDAQSGSFFFRKNGLGRTEAWLWLAALFVVSTIAANANGPSLGSFLFAVLNQNLIYVFGYAVIVKSVLASPDAPLGADVKIAALCGVPLILVIGLTGVSDFDGLAAMLFGVLLVATKEPALRAAGIVFLALSANLFWGPVAFALFKDLIITVDATLAELALRVSGHEVQRTDYTLSAQDGHRVRIVGACSSFNNITLAVLAAVTALVAVNGRLSLKDIRPIVIVSLVVLAFNTIRLAVFASSYDSYLYWHNGEGAQVITLAFTALVIACAAWVAMSRRAPKMV